MNLSLSLSIYIYITWIMRALQRDLFSTRYISNASVSIDLIALFLFRKLRCSVKT